MNLKQRMIESLEHSIKVAEDKIEELKKPSQKSTVHMRAAERDFWRNNEKVYIEGRVVGSFAGTLGSKGKKIHLTNGDIVDVDDSFIIESIEPEKPVVPAVVSVWYQINKDNLYKNIAYLCANWVKSTNDDTLFNWISNTDNFIEIIVNMHKFGYEVEEKKRYRVKMKGMSEENTYLTFRFGHTWMLSNFEECEEFRLHHTRKELEEDGFGWVFDCPGVEVEEVK